MFEKERANVILCLYKLKEKLKKEKESNYLKELSINLEKNFKNLEECFLIEIRSSMELDLKKRSSYPAFLWQRKLVYLYHIFVTIVGVLDARYDDCERCIEFKSKFNEKEEIKEYQNEKNRLLSYRNKIIEDYLNITDHNELNITREVLERVPSYLAFDKLLKNMSKTSYQLSLQGEVVSAYMNGYNKSMYFQSEEIMEIYEKLILNFYKRISKINKNNNLVKTLGVKETRL